MTKNSNEYSLRCEIMAVWSGKSQTLARFKVIQIRCFQALKNYQLFKKHSKLILENKKKKLRIKNMRDVF